MMLALCLLLAQDFEKLAPYSDVRWVADAPEVQVDGAWYALLEIDGTPAADIVAFARKTWKRIWKKRFEEDLVEVLSKMGKPPGRKVALKLRDKDGAEKTMNDVAMTKENRNKIWEASRAKDAPAEPPKVPRAQAAADLDVLKSLIDDAYSYAELRGVKYADAIEAAKKRLPESMPPRAFALEVQKILTLFRDGHTGVEAETLEDGYLPFLVAEVEGGVAAFREDRSGLFEPEFPFLKSIDGVEISKWLEAAERVAPIRRARAVRHVRALRAELGLAHKDVAALEFAAAKGGVKRVEVPMAARKPIYGEWPRSKSRLLDGGIGYLRLEKMNDDAVAEVTRGMEEFRKTAGLIIDVRGNGGGSRDALRELFPYFMSAADAPRVANVAASRVAGQSLEDRWLFPLDKLTEPERAAVRKLNFKPEWTPPAGRFGEWNYFVLRPGGAPYHYDLPVVILMDGDCFSATDIFLGAFKGWKNVTLLGRRSGGGSGRARRHPLMYSRLFVTLSSMASFRPDGKLYDGRGVEPDVVLPIRATDLIGETDTALDAARKRLGK